MREDFRQRYECEQTLSNQQKHEIISLNLQLSETKTKEIAMKDSLEF